MDDIKIKCGTKEDFRIAIDNMYENVHWFNSYEDFNVYTNACPDGYKFMSAKKSKGEFVGSSSIALYRDGIAFIDQFFVMPEYRKLGIGRQLFEAIFDENLRKDYNVGLHSEVAISDYYNKKHGFNHFNDVFIDVIRITNILERSSRNKNFRTTTNAIEALDDVCKFDARIWKKSRKVFLSEWIQRKDARFLAVYINGEMFGYGVIRHATSKSGYLFGPIYAINDEAFLTLFDGLVESVENDAVIELRSPSINSARLHQLLDNRATLNNYSKYITQYTKSIPECNYEPVYAITDTSIPV
ncbi:hypothetical protein Tcan_08195 [Toxocara canis]|uniref:N-acetyltransferase domain-containing protein n=1 Tax=Toxocara canis TaxID=6265 RepID=A0A0B2VPQ5_TOXCA|nr:hypothetical protein Tcan_08195 [Toxocara canis]